MNARKTSTDAGRPTVPYDANTLHTYKPNAHYDANGNGHRNKFNPRAHLGAIAYNNANTNANASTSANVNANVDTNTNTANANVNANASDNANVDTNANTNGNIITNANTNSNTNANVNTYVNVAANVNVKPEVNFYVNISAANQAEAQQSTESNLTPIFGRATIAHRALESSIEHPRANRDKHEGEGGELAAVQEAGQESL
jgi:hypothetical protein